MKSPSRVIIRGSGNCNPGTKLGSVDLPQKKKRKKTSGVVGGATEVVAKATRRTLPIMAILLLGNFHVARGAEPKASANYRSEPCALQNSVVGEVETSVHKADDYANKNDFSEALKIYQQTLKKCEEALKANSAQPNILRVKSKCLYELSSVQAKHDKTAAAKTRALALTASQDALKLAPNSTTVILWRADCLRRCANDELDLERRDYATQLASRAVECYDRFISLSNAPKAFSGKGAAFLIEAFCIHEFPNRISLMEKAIASFESAINAGDRSAPTYAELGKTQSDLSQYYSYLSEDNKSKKYAILALENFKKAMAADPSCKSYIQEDYKVVEQRIAGTYRDVKLEQQVKAIKNTLQGTK